MAPVRSFVETWCELVKRVGIGDPDISDNQRDAILIDQDNVLVLAGAGTGKTRTAVGRVRYLLNWCDVDPGRILVLAFNNKAVGELAERFGEHSGVKVATFHKFGMDVIAESTGRRPTVEFSSPGSRPEWIQRQMEHLIDNNSEVRIAIERFLLYEFSTVVDPSDCENTHEYAQRNRSIDLRTLAGERVKSEGERRIADWLFVRGIPYEYERDYEHPTATIEKRQYTPDFSLPGSGIYIEYVGIDREGGTAPWVDLIEYTEGMDWKRRLHSRYGTTMIELSYAALQNDLLLKELDDAMTFRGVERAPISTEELLQRLNERGRVSILAKLIDRVLALAREGRTAGEILRKRAHSGKDRIRHHAFLDVFEPVRQAYEAHLSEIGRVDFPAMIAKAAGELAKTSGLVSFDHIIVDEFQDISESRANLLQALIRHCGGSQLFCVGDDWQSIYRFAGSDISIIRRFAERFGNAALAELNTTYRYPEELVSVSREFVLKNPDQTVRDLEASRDEHGKLKVLGRPAVSVVLRGEQAVEIVRDRISLDSPLVDPVILILGRYRFCDPNWGFGRFSTVHAAKGLEADYVVIVDVNAGRFGFPTELEDDPILDLVLPSPERMRNAEERRVFYVALTRAKHGVFVVADPKQRSAFVDELESMGEGRVDTSGLPTQPRCLECGGGFLQIMPGPYGNFVGCTNYPYCKHTEEACPKCSDAPMGRQNGVFACLGQDCDAEFNECPGCKSGYLRKQTGSRGEFLGCSAWRRSGGCDFTCDVEAPAKPSGVEDN